MRVTVKLFARLRDVAGAAELTRDVDAGATVRIVGICSGAFNPDVATVEELALPDRRDLFHALDGIAAGRERVSTVGRCCRNRDAHATDLDPSDAMMERQTRVRPLARNLCGDALESTHRQWLIGLVFEVVHATSDVVIANHTEEGRHCTIRSARVAAVGDGCDQWVQRQGHRADREQRDFHFTSISDG